jgi:transcriptional regulator with XRE-family HTH domain
MSRIADPPRNRFESVGERLNLALQARRVQKMAALAAQLCVDESALSRWRRGGQIPTAHVMAICEALDISADWLLMGRGAMDLHKSDPASRLEDQLTRALRALRDEEAAQVYDTIVLLLAHYTRARQSSQLE